MKTVITGGAGFIGSHLTDALLKRGNAVTVVDNLSSGKKEFLAPHAKNKRFRFVKRDLREASTLKGVFDDADTVYHLAAAVEVRRSAQKPEEMYENNILATYNVLNALRKSSAKKFVLSSSVTVFGEVKKIPTPEDYGPLRPISFYGASKLADEAMASACAGLYGFDAVTYRFANIIGPRGTHGVIRDFIMKLRANPKVMEILGDGKQNKSYLHVDDCVAALLLAGKAAKPYDVLHVGSDDSTTVKQIADIVADEMGLKNVKYAYTGGHRGWPGDIIRSQLDASRLKKLGWKARHNSSQAVRMTVRELLKEI
jgi:UDP-glucose 4-epimerase